MSQRILDGKACASAVKAELAQRVAALKAAGVTPGLGTILVGDDPASHAYVAGKHRDCEAIGITGLHAELPADATQADVAAAVRQFNEDPACTGYIVQLPLPSGLDEHAILELMDPAKDADGLHPVNLGLVVTKVNQALTGPAPCTPAGVIELLQRNDIELAGKHIVVVGRSILVGRTLSLLLTRKAINATVTNCHTGTKDLAAHTHHADIIVAAVGVPGMLTADLVPAGAVLVDVGINRVDDTSNPRGYRLVGDISDAANELASAYTPVPGGIGPMTRAMLLHNVVAAAERQAGITP